MADGNRFGPLAGVRVLDLTRVLSGPFATMVLADLGADVVKVERPGDGDETRTVVRYEQRNEEDQDYFYVANRNKRSIVLDLKSPAGHNVARRLATAADVVVENFAAGVMERLGLDYAALSEDNPALIYCSISGFGPDGPYQGHKSYDSIIQALGGVMSITGEPGGRPVRSGLMIGDLAGSLYAVIAIQSALRERDVSGQGQRIDIPLLDALISLLTVNAAEYLANGRVPRPVGSDNPNRSPARAFRAGDGRYVQVLAATPRLWEAFCAAIEMREFLDDERFVTHQQRLANRGELYGLIERRFEQRSAAAWVELLNCHGVPCGLVQDLDEVFHDPHVRQAGLLRSVEHPVSGPIQMIASPMRFSRTTAGIRRPPPLLGQHTGEVLDAWLDCSADEVARLRGEGAFG